MKKTLLALAFHALTAWAASGQGAGVTNIAPKRLDPTSTFPANATEGGKFTVTREDAAIISGGKLYLPRNFTIYVAKDVDRIDWSFDKLQFGVGATIDLSRVVSFPAPVKASNGQNMRSCQGSARQCDHKQNNIVPGKDGSPGHPGANGFDGATLRLTVHSIPATGSLWIRTDGANGEDGGSGGDGGNGDWANSDGSHYHRGGDGGRGGAAGHGGNGGNTASVEVLLIDQSGTILRERKGSCSTKFGPSTPAPTVNDDNGEINIFGNPGSKGLKGNPGQGGERGHGVPAGFGRKDPSDGSNGKPGDPSFDGSNGVCSTTLQ